MAVHDKFAALAERLIAKHGRPMTLKQLSRDPANASQPWRGPATSTASGYADTEDVIAVVTDFDEEEIDGTLVKRGDKKVIVAAKPSATKDLSDFDVLLDGTLLYHLGACNTVHPGTTKIMYTFPARA